MWLALSPAPLCSCGENDPGLSHTGRDLAKTSPLLDGGRGSWRGAGGRRQPYDLGLQNAPQTLALPIKPSACPPQLRTMCTQLTWPVDFTETVEGPGLTVFSQDTCRVSGARRL